MAKFVIHGDVSGTGQSGWLEEDVSNAYGAAATIEKISDDSVDNRGKIGTSIPTPIARIRLFETALRIVSSKLTQGEDPDQSYYKLISECFDLMQFVFEKGGSVDLKIEAWGIKDNIEKLKNSRYAGHKTMARSLEVAFGLHQSVGGVGNIYSATGQMLLISYKGILLGGYSPTTMVYTAPNLWNNILKAVKDKRGLVTMNDFLSKCGRRLFDPSAPALLEQGKRSEAFLDFIYALPAIIETNTPLRAFLSDRGIERQLGKQNLFEGSTNNTNPTYKSIYGSGNSLFYDNSPVDTTKSGLKLESTVKHYVNMPGYENFIQRSIGSDGKEFEKVYPPLVLCRGEGGGFIYIDDEEWLPNTQIPNIRHHTIPNRSLPINGTNTTSLDVYPYITIDDFLQDAIIYVDYDIDDAAFASCSSKFVNSNIGESSGYLLPIKKEYFMFFTMNDLKRQMTVNLDNVNESISVSLRIPVTGRGDGGFVTFRRTYESQRKGDYTYPIIRYNSNADSLLTMSIFPSYRVKEQREVEYPQEVKNRYFVQMAQSYNKEDESHPIIEKVNYYSVDGVAIVKPLKSEKRVRTEDSTSNVDRRSVYFDITDNFVDGIGSNNFDMVEVDLNQGKYKFQMLLLPQWGRELDAIHGSTGYNYAVDFGTSNTHIAYSIGSEINTYPFIVEKQALYLPKRLSDANLLLGAMFEREFVSKEVSYPMITSVLENPKFTASQEGMLFSNINVGYKMEEENSPINPRIMSSFSYVTDLKWAFQKLASDESAKGSVTLAKERVNTYCEQTMWTIRNHILMNGASPSNSKLVIFTPSSMSDEQEAVIRDAWAQAIDSSVMRDMGWHSKDNLTVLSESLAPYNAIVVEEGADRIAGEGESVVNIDIGGGTTDIFFYNGDNRAGLESSIFFAGNDIWGNGLKSSTKLNNGIVLYGIEQLKRDISKDNREAHNLIAIIEGYSSSDASSMLFKSDLNYKTMLTRNNNIKGILLIHYVAIMYYLVEIAEKYNLPVPTGISFTGMGSLYIELFTTKDTLASVTKAILKTYTSDVSKHAAIDRIRFNQFENPKEMTAIGGLKGAGIIQDNIDIYENNAFTVGTGQSKEPNYTYRELLKDSSRDMIIGNFSNFIHKLYNSNYVNEAFGRSGSPLVENGGFTIENWVSAASTSYIEAILMHSGPREELKQARTSVFFYTLKDAIFRMSHHLNSTRK